MTTAHTPTTCSLRRAGGIALIVLAAASSSRCKDRKAEPGLAPSSIAQPVPGAIEQPRAATPISPAVGEGLGSSAASDAPLLSPIEAGAPTTVDPRRWIGAADAHAPRVPAAEELFFQMKKARIERFDEPLLVLCRVVVSGGNFDMFAEPDLIMDLGVGHGDRVKQWGGLNSSVGYVSCPIAAIANGDRVSIRVDDQDVTTVEYIGETSENFDGQFPVELETRHVTATCRAEALSNLRPSVERYLADADAGLARLHRSVPKPKAEDWGFPGQEVARVRASLSGAAGFVGWKDRGVNTRLTALARFEQAFAAAAARSVDETVRGLASQQVPARGAGVAVSISGMSCQAGARLAVQEFPPSQPSLTEQDPYFCVVRLHVENVIQAPVILDASAPSLGHYDELRLVAANGATAPVVVSTDGSCTDGLTADSTNRTVQIPSGQACELSLTNSTTGGELPERPRLLWLGSKTAKPLLLPLDQ